MTEAAPHPEAQKITFRDLPLSKPLQEALERLGFVYPTPIQRLSIPKALRARDLLARAPTGTGKTLAFTLPALERLLHAPPESRAGTRIVVLAPTRELALQIRGVMEEFGNAVGISSCALVGGLPLRADAIALRRHPNIIVATPGRLLDHVRQRNVDLSRTAILVFDEADRMLDLGFLPQILSILKELPENRQTMLFSATIPVEIANLAARHTKDPVRVEVAAPTATARNAEQRVIFISMEQKVDCLVDLLRTSDGTCLVFVATKSNADWLYQKTRTAGLPVAVLHGDLPQNQRIRALEAFSTGEARILIATDVAGRGLDVEGIAHVINYDVPEDPDDYIHRIGRTARADASGVATTLASYDELEYIYTIERHLKRSIPRCDPPSGVQSPPWAANVRVYSNAVLSHEGVFAPGGFRVPRRRR